MASTFSTNKNFELMADGEDIGTWGSKTNANLGILDTISGGRVSLTLASSNVTLSTAQSQNQIFLLGGTLTANVVITYPAVGGLLVVNNGTSGNFTVTVASAGGGSSVVVTQGITAWLYSDATNIALADNAALAQVSTLTDGASVALNAALGNEFLLTTTTNPTIAAPTNATSGKKIIIRIKASGAARTVTLNTGAGGFRYGSDITALTDVASGKTDYIGAVYNATDSFWDVVAYVKGF